MSRICPACWRHIDKTRYGNICGHLDKTQHPCPASFQPYEIAYTTTRNREPTT